MSLTATVRVPLGARSYDIVIQPDLLKDIPTRLTDLGAKGVVGIVTDRHVARHYLKRFLAHFRAVGLSPVAVVLPPGERTKTLASTQRILDVFARHRFERSSFLVALGGGVIGDLTGFAAAIYQRGIPFVQVPTTLVSQVDSSVGGKTGVDHPLGKNLIGAIYQPRAVYIDPLTLRTLPEREWVAGLAEVIKYGIIADASLFSFLCREMPFIRARRPDIVTRVIRRSCEIKAQVVADDERESDRRRVLNYGHTIGHALESLGNYRSLIHGEAVGIGLVQEADLARHLGFCDRTVVDEIRKLVISAGLSDRLPLRSSVRVWKAMLHDKKVSDGRVIGVWPEKIGRVRMAPVQEAEFHRWYASATAGVSETRKAGHARRGHERS